MDDDPVPFQFPAAVPFSPPEPQDKDPFSREPLRKRGRPRKAEGKKRGPKPGSKRKPKAVFEAELERRGADEVQRSLTFPEMAGMLNKLTLVLSSVPPSQRKELLTYLLGQQ